LPDDPQDDRDLALVQIGAACDGAQVVDADVGGGISARELNLGTDVMAAQTPAVIKAGGPVVLTDKVGSVVR
jgi:hypothetical protein